MKLLIIVYNEALNDEILQILKKHGTNNYTKWTKVYGRGESSGPHLGTHVWPKANNVMAVVVEDQPAKALMYDLRLERSCLAHEGIKAFVLPVEDVT